MESSQIFVVVICSVIGLYTTWFITTFVMEYYHLHRKQTPDPASVPLIP